MSLVILGQSAGPTKLSANDDVFGLMTQVPEGAVRHSPDGLANADSNTAYGVPFTLVSYFSGSSPTGGFSNPTVALCSADAPYKFRVLKARVTMIDDANGRLRDGMNSLNVYVTQAGNSVASGDMTDLRQLEDRDLEMSRTGGEVVNLSGTLTVGAKIRLGETGSTDTLTFQVELTCLRVI